MQRFATPKSFSAIIGVAALVGIGVLSFYQNPITIILPLSLVAGLASFWALQSQANTYFTPVRSKPAIALAAICLSLSITVISFRGWVTVSWIALSGTFLVATFIAVSTDRPRAAVPIAILTSLSHATAVFFDSEIILGNDPLHHARLVEGIQKAASNEPLETSKYFFSPLYHYFEAIGLSILGIDIQSATYATGTIATIAVFSLGIYWLGQNLSVRIGSLAVVLYLAADFTTYYAVSPQPSSFAVLIAILLPITIIHYVRQQQLRWGCLTVSLLGVIVFTHQLSTFIVIFSLGSLATAGILLRDKSMRSITLRLWALTSFLACASWLYSGYSGVQEGSQPILARIIQFIIYEIQTLGRGTSTPATVPTGYIVGLADALTVVQVLGLGVLFTAGVIGGLRLADKERTRQAAVYAGILVVTFSVAVFGGPLIGTDQMRPERWWVYLYVPLVLLASVGLIYTIHALPNIRENVITISMIVLLLIIVPYTLSMTGNYRGSISDPMFDNAAAAERFGVSEQETSGLLWTTNHVRQDRQVVSDVRLSVPLQRWFGHSGSITIRWNPSKNWVAGSVAVLRPYQQTSQAQSDLLVNNSTTRVRGPIPKSQSRWNVVYDNNNTEVVIK